MFVLQLETELAAKEQERADMERVSKAFGEVIAEAHARIAMLQQERDGLMVRIER